VIEVREVDAADDADVVRCAAVLTAYWREVLGPDEPAYEVDEMANTLRDSPPDTEVLAWLALDDGAELGLAVLDLRTGRGNDHLAWLPDLYVQPHGRRQGAGRRLLDEVVVASRARDRTLVAGAHVAGDEAASAFAAAVGAAGALTDDQNRCRTADLDPTMLRAWLVEPRGYSLVTWDGRCPDDLVERFARLHDAMNDAPTSDAVNPWVSTPELVRQREDVLVSTGVVRWTVAARHDASGDLAGFTELDLSPFRSWLARQGDTGVAVAHRGHGIGRWLKAVNALRLPDERPDVTSIETWNASTNDHMNAINRAMGFRRVAQWQELELSI
jgi:GNAT superfamily N-acetyltransferase